MPLSTTQKDALAEFAGLRQDGDEWREATAAELAEAPSALKDLRDSQLRRTRRTAAFLSRINRTETVASRYAVRRVAAGTLELLDSALQEAQS